MLNYKKQIHDYILKNKDEIVEILKELVKIPSVRDEAEVGAPFGKACADVLEYTKKLYMKNGFKTELETDGGYLLSYYGEGAKSLGLFAHADVVPVSGDWILTNPFEPIEKDGFLIGRGVMDDKSAVVISLYCAKILKELNIPFKSRLVCFTGSNEESGMQDIKNYVNNHKAPDFSLVCDTAFPLYRGNKGMLQLTAVCNRPLNIIKAINGSNAKGAILGKVKIVLDYSDEVYIELKKHENENIDVTAENNETIIEARGISKHTALPEGSVNAGYLAFCILSESEDLTQAESEEVKFISNLLSRYYGEAIGIENTDSEFGKLTFANDMINFENSKINLHFNLRFGACVDIKALKEKINEEFSKRDWDVFFEIEAPAHITDINNPMLQACLKAYKDYTGDINPTVYVNAGGTYARHLPSAVEIGTTLKWGYPGNMPQGHGAVHQPDECISIEGILEALELTVLMLLECDKKEQIK